MIVLIYFHSTSFLSISNSLMQDETAGAYEVYSVTKWAIISVMIYLCFPLFVLFQILGWLEPKKKH